ncbi:MAG: S8 family serine peptidase [Cyanobacteriota bacterium]|nr:S8 family serine peptidase [Cyanobacteriota bacterium]
MTRQKQAELPSKIYAEAVVRSASGDSLLQPSSLVTSQNVTRFYADPHALSSAVDRLHAEGFEVLDIGTMSISIAASPNVYERSLNPRFTIVERPVIKELGIQTTATFIDAADTEQFGKIDTSRTNWADVLDGIAINEPVYYFQRNTPSAFPPPTSTKYLQVPDDIACGLNANLVHQDGITGNGVKVVMVDTGLYAHPFFKQHNYRINVVLAPGSTDPDRDAKSHGTGEAANVLAVAPEAELTMVKADVALNGRFRNVNSIAAFKTAVALRPDIISCSWGADVRGHQLSAYDLALAGVVADAVRRGIIVIFSAGNGHWGFPAQHPDTIAAGGVYMHLEEPHKGQLEASNYSSGFISQIYRGRRVPDVCGLVGQLPHGAYIMLPVAPGSQGDRRHSSLGDGTSPTDGWATFSGTSAAAPQLAGICALMRQIDPGLSPARVKEILQQTARDVVRGACNTVAGGHRSQAGLDLATGYGLADAYTAIERVKAAAIGESLDASTPHLSNSAIETGYQWFDSSEATGSKGTRASPALFSSIKYQESPQLYKASKPSRINRTKTMYSDNPKLKEKLEKIQLKLDEIFQNKFKDLAEDFELVINESNFVPRSPQSHAISSLVTSLKELKVYGKTIAEITENKNKKTEGEIQNNIDDIQKKHVLAAQSLLKVKKYSKLAIGVLIAAIDSPNNTVSEMAIEALGELSSDRQIPNILGNRSTSKEYDFLEGSKEYWAYINGNDKKPEQCTSVDSNGKNKYRLSHKNNDDTYTRYLCDFLRTRRENGKNKHFYNNCTLM